MKTAKRILAVCFCLVLLLTLFPVAAEAPLTDEATILFTHDLHSHFLPVPAGEGHESGGYARLMTLLRQQREKHGNEAVITVDGGDFSMGSLFQTVFTTVGAELRILGDMEYDVTTFGNHEFDFRQRGLSAMLEAASAARDAGEKLPKIVQTNYWPDKAGSEAYSEDDGVAQKAFEDFGVTEYTVIERNGLKFGVFGLLGADAHGDSPLSGMAFEAIADAAKRAVAALKAEAADYIICLSHTGTDGGDLIGKNSEDYQLAATVDGIDLIISGHTHSTLREPLTVNGTVIVSCGSYAKNLGVVCLGKDADGKTQLRSYELLPVDETVADDPAVAARVEDYKQLVAEDYLSGFEGMDSFDNVIAHADFHLDSAYGKLQDKALGNLITESYYYAMEHYAGTDAAGDAYDPIDMAVVPCGVIRDTLPEGDITVSNAFDVLSLGVGADGTAGYPLVSVYLYGKELKTAFEIDASLSKFLSIAQMYATGMTWEWNSHRMLLNRVENAYAVKPDGTHEALENDKLYHIVTGQNCCQMLGKVTEMSKGLITITPRDQNGDPVNDGGTYDTCIIHKPDGSELKEWYAFASYLRSFPDTDGDSIPDLPDSYRTPKGNKFSVDSWNPVDLLKNINIYTIILLALILVVLLLIILLIRRICRGGKKKKAARKKAAEKHSAVNAAKKRKKK